MHISGGIWHSCYSVTIEQNMATVIYIRCYLIKVIDRD